jgi:hypothetical protein
VHAGILDQEETAFLTSLNRYRLNNNLSLFKVSKTLCSVAEWMSTDLAKRSGFSHTDSRGRGLVQRLADAGYPSSDMRENILAGTQWGTEAFGKWRNSPGHNANFLCTKSTEIGIARVYSAKSKYHWYWTCIFGSNSSSSTQKSEETSPIEKVTSSTPTETPEYSSQITEQINKPSNNQSMEARVTNVVPWFDVFDDFEQGWSKWNLDGNAWDKTPVSYQTYSQVTHIHGDYYASTLSPRHGFAAKGRATSKDFVITRYFIHFLIGGGNRPDECYFNLLVDGQVVRRATGNNSPMLSRGCWDVSDLVGKTAELVIGDSARNEPRGYIMVDNIAFSDLAVTPVTNPKNVNLIAITQQGRVESTDRLVLTPSDDLNVQTTSNLSPRKGLCSSPERMQQSL